VEHASSLNPGLILLQLEIPTPTVLRAAQIAKAKHAKVILNPAPAKELPNELIALADYIIPNETELSLLTGMEVNDAKSASAAAHIVLNRGAKNVIVTLGSKGALLVNKDVSQQVDTYQVNVVDTTAAGDAFIGGFASVLDSSSLLDAIRYGCACGALAATKFGAQPSMPTNDEVKNLIGK
jgi:ribokinase